MASITTIEWTARRRADGSIRPGSTWTPIRARVRNDAAAIAREKGYRDLVQIGERMAGRVGPHCERISPACATPCYSEVNNSRCLPANGTGLPFDRRARDLVEMFVDPNILRQPMTWREPRTIFVCSQTDLFGEWVPEDDIWAVLAVASLCPHHRFLLLTKRPGRALKLLSDLDEAAHAVSCFSSDVWTGLFGESVERAAVAICKRFGKKTPIGEDPVTEKMAYLWPPPPFEWPLPNVWIGVTAENQVCADERVPLLLQIPAVKHFVSCEPLLEEIDLRRWLYPSVRIEGGKSVALPSLGWVIAGGATGAEATPSRAGWFRRLRDDASAAGAAFFFQAVGRMVGRRAGWWLGF